MRMASLGQASTQKPQTTQRSSSISNRTGYFSAGAGGVPGGRPWSVAAVASTTASPATMWMQSAGHTVAHIMHATQRTEPSSRRMSRCSPRNRGG